MDEEKIKYVIARRSQDEPYRIVFCGGRETPFIDSSIRQFGVDDETAQRTSSFLEKVGYDSQIVEFDYLKLNDGIIDLRNFKRRKALAFFEVDSP